ncbi:MAG: hypothetical protein H6619_05650 [Deltaproteobacteria bacterium]|nr:hypothetical protein [Deltaproteobacteria bacterium]
MVRVLIVDGDNNSRIRLKQAATKAAPRAEIISVDSCSLGLKEIGEKSHFQYIFLSSSLDHEKIKDFLKEAKEKQGKKVFSSVLVIQGKDNDRSFIAQSYLNGFNGILCSPYSISDISELVKVVALNKATGKGPEERSAAGFLLDGALSLIDEIALKMALEKPTGKERKRLIETAQTLSSLCESLDEEYYKLAVRKLERVPAPKDVIGKKRKKAEEEKVDQTKDESKKSKITYTTKKNF